MTTPRVTVIVPTYDRPRFLREALSSIFGQTFENFELIVVDDGSTDETQEVLARVGDPRMRVIRQEHRGIGASLNSGLAAAGAPYVARLDDDDLWLPDLLATQVRVLDEQPEVGMVYARCELMAADGTPGPGTHGAPLRHPHDPFRSLLYGDCTTSITSVYQRSALEEVGGWVEARDSSEDWEAALCVARHHDIAFVDRVLARVRRHSGNSIQLRSPDFDERLVGRQRVLDGVFARGDLPPSTAAMRPIAYRNLHTGAALQLAALNRWGDARQELARAFAAGGNPFATAGRIAWSFLLWHGIGRFRTTAEIARKVMTHLRAARATS